MVELMSGKKAFTHVSFPWSEAWQQEQHRQYQQQHQQHRAKL